MSGLRARPVAGSCDIGCVYLEYVYNGYIDNNPGSI